MAATIIPIIVILVIIAIMILGPILVPEKKPAPKTPAYEVVNFDADGGWQFR